MATKPPVKGRDTKTAATEETEARNLGRVVGRATTTKQQQADQKATERDTASNSSNDPAASEQLTREQIVEQLKDLGLFNRQIIGVDPSQATDEDLRDALNEAAQHLLVHETTGQDPKTVKQSDVEQLLRGAKDQAVEALTGKTPAELTNLERAIIEQRLRDAPDQKANTEVGDVLERIVEGKPRLGATDESAKAPATPTTPVKPDVPSPIQVGGGSGTGSSDAGKGTERGERGGGDQNGGGGTGSGDGDQQTLTRAEIIEQLKDLGSFDRHIIGVDPDKLSDADLRDELDDAADRLRVSQTLIPGQKETETDPAQVKQADIDKFLADARNSAFEQATGTKLTDLTGVDRLIADQRFRDQPGVPANQEFSDLVGRIASGKVTGTDAPADDHTDHDPSNGGGTGGDDEFFGDPFDRAGEGTERDDESGTADPVTGGADDPEGAPPSNDGTGIVDDPGGGQDPQDPAGDPPSGDPGGSADPDSQPGDSSGGGDGEDDSNGDTVHTVFQVSGGETDSDPSSSTFGDGPLETFYRDDEGNWYDEDGHPVTDQDNIDALESQYDEFKDAGGEDTDGTLQTSDTTFEEAVEQANAGSGGDDSGGDDTDGGDTGGDTGGTDAAPTDEGGEGGEGSADGKQSVEEQSGDPAGPGVDDFDRGRPTGPLPTIGPHDGNDGATDPVDPNFDSGTGDLSGTPIRSGPGVADPAGPNSGIDPVHHGDLSGVSPGGSDPRFTDPGPDDDFGTGSKPLKSDDPFAQHQSFEPIGVRPQAGSNGAAEDDTADDPAPPVVLHVPDISLRPAHPLIDTHDLVGAGISDDDDSDDDDTP